MLPANQQQFNKKHSQSDKPRVIFFGSGQLSVGILEFCLTNLPEINIVGIITNPVPSKSHHQQQNSPVAILAEASNILCLRPENLDTCIAQIKGLKPQVGLLMAYGKMLPKTVLDCFPNQIVNIHPSLLPRHRGPSPIEATILNGDSQAGTSLMLISPDMDAGPIIAQVSFPISQTITKTDLTNKLMAASQQLLAKHFINWVIGQPISQPQSQPKWRNVSYCSLISKQSGLIDLNQETAVSLDRKVRAYVGWPGVRLFVKYRQAKTDLIVLEASHLDEIASAKPSIIFQDGKLIAQTHFGKVELLKVQLPGKAPISGRDLVNAGAISLA